MQSRIVVGSGFFAGVMAIISMLMFVTPVAEARTRPYKPDDDNQPIADYTTKTLYNYCLYKDKRYENYCGLPFAHQWCMEIGKDPRYGSIGWKGAVNNAAVWQRKPVKAITVAWTAPDVAVNPSGTSRTTDTIEGITCTDETALIPRSWQSDTFPVARSCVAPNEALRLATCTCACYAVALNGGRPLLDRVGVDLSTATCERKKGLTSNVGIKTCEAFTKAAALEYCNTGGYKTVVDWELAYHTQRDGEIFHWPDRTKEKIGGADDTLGTQGVTTTGSTCFFKSITCGKLTALAR